VKTTDNVVNKTPNAPSLRCKLAELVIFDFAMSNTFLTLPQVSCSNREGVVQTLLPLKFSKVA